jgi:hypothetical protein
MQRNFTDENFEGFLRSNSDGLRMRPSDKVWKGISSHLNRTRRRMGYLFGLILLIGTGVGYYFIEEQAAPKENTRPASAGSQSSDARSVSTATATSATTTTSQATLPGHVTASTVLTVRPLVFSRQSNPFISCTIVSPTIEQEVTANQDFTPTAVDDYFEKPLHQQQTTSLNQVAYADPMTIESIINTYSRKKKGKLGVQIYFTPTVSYRKLSENKDYLRSLPPGSPPITNPDYDNINSAVTHKPDFGFEMGIAAKYPVSKKVKLRAGLQFNVNRYEIKTYNTSTELATIHLNNRNGMDSLNAVTNYNNFGGYRSNWLENFYFQVSAPVGMELKLKGDDKMQFGIATTIQPTYVLGDRVYLISTDYKNYAEVPRLIRRWNVNTNLETYVAYSTGRLKWQVGPQVRYQLLSSFVKKYPVKEHLFDFGLKMGVSLNGK